MNRGLAYWRLDTDTERLYFGTGDGYLIALDAGTGRPVPSFGDAGRVDLTSGLRRPVNRAEYSVTSPPIVSRGVVIVGSSVLDPVLRQAGAPGDVRGFDARTGKLRWTFHTIAQRGRPGAETWEDGSSERTGNANVWTIMSADESLGYVYLPVSTPTSDFYGGHRRGANTCMATASWPSARKPASASGISRRRTMDCGITTCRRPPCWPMPRSVDGREDRRAGHEAGFLLRVRSGNG